MGEAEQASANAAGDARLMAEDRRRREAAKAPGSHASIRGQRSIPSPLDPGVEIARDRKTSFSVAAWRHGATMTGMIQHLPFAGLATVDGLQL
jgi:hypothetical protein